MNHAHHVLEYPACLPLAYIGQTYRLWNLQTLGGELLTNPLRHALLPGPGAARIAAQRPIRQRKLVHQRYRYMGTWCNCAPAAHFGGPVPRQVPGPVYVRLGYWLLE